VQLSQNSPKLAQISPHCEQNWLKVETKNGKIGIKVGYLLYISTLKVLSKKVQFDGCYDKHCNKWCKPDEK
jgi:hypothetical protein